MKKFFVISLAALFCLGMTLPAMAKVRVGGMVTQDVMYFNQDEARVRSITTYGGAGVPTFPVPAPNPQNDFSVLDMTLPQGLNRLDVAYSNDDNTIRGFIELRGGVGTGADNLNAITNPNSVVIWNYAWIDWVLTPKDFVRFGRQTQAFAIRAPDQWLGQNRGHIVGAGFGNVHGGASRDGVRWYHTFTDQVHFELAIYDPANNGADAIGTFSAQVIGGATATILEQNVMPRIDVTAPLFFGNLTLWPSFTYLKQKYDQVAPGMADDFDIWGFALGAQYVFGPVTFNGEATVGQNLGSGNYSGGTGAAPAVYMPIAGGPGYVNDASITAWWFEVGWKVGPATLQGIIGSSHVKRGDDPALGSVTSAATNLDFTRWMYGIDVPITIAKGFQIKPEVMFYDYDTSATFGNDTVRDLGKEYCAGVQFQLAF